MTSTKLILGSARAHELAQQIAKARARLADLDATYTSEKAKVDTLRAKLFFALRKDYEKRDEAELLLKSKRAHFDGLKQRVQDAKKRAAREFDDARDSNRQRYKEAAAELDKKKVLSSDEEKELHELWRKLVRLYHPDRYANDARKQAAYNQLTAAINSAKDSGDLATLREIAKDPDAFMMKKGWDRIDFADSMDVLQLEKLLHALTLEIEKALSQLTNLRTSSEYDLLQIVGKSPDAFDSAVDLQRSELDRQTKLFELETAAVIKNIKRAES